MRTKILQLLLCIPALAVAGVALAAAGPVYSIVAGWGQVPGNGQWGDVPGVAIDRDGNIYAFRRAEPPILKFDPSGKLLASLGQGMIGSAHGIRVDRDGFLWAADFRAVDGKGQQVLKMTLDGKVVMALGTKGVAGTTDATFNGPCDVAFGANGDIFVAD